MTLRRRLLATTAGSSASTISVSWPSSDNSLPRMISLFFTRWTSWSYSARAGNWPGNSGAGSASPCGGWRAENIEIMPLVPSISCRSVTRSRSFSIEPRSSRLLPSTTTRTSYSFEGKRCVTCSKVLNSGVSDRNSWLRESSTLIRASPNPAAINNTMATSPITSGKRKEIKPMRSSPRAMLCNPLVRGEPGLGCLDFDVSMFCGLPDDRRCGWRDAAMTFSSRSLGSIWIGPRMRGDHDGHQVRVLARSMPDSSSSSCSQPQLDGRQGNHAALIYRRRIEGLAIMAGATPTGGKSDEPSAATARLEPRDDHQNRIWRLGDRRRRLGVRLGAARRRRFVGDHASRTRARGELDRYGRRVRAWSFRGSGRPAAARTDASGAPDGLHQVWIDLGSEQSDGPAATRAQAGIDQAGMRRFAAAVGRGTHRSLPIPLAG